MRTTRVTLALVVLLALIALTPTAYASPPDPTWISGLYDNADFDDVILFIAGSLSAIGHDGPSFVRPPSIVAGSVMPEHVVPPLSSSLSSDPSRAPPLA